MYGLGLFFEEEEEEEEPRQKRTIIRSSLASQTRGLASETTPGDLQPPSLVQPYAHANLYIQLFIPRDSSYSCVKSPEFYNLIGAFTFLRAAILLA